MSTVPSQRKNVIFGSVRRIAVAVTVIATFLYLAACVLLYFKQRTLLYFPTPVSKVAPEASFELASGSETLKILTRPHIGSDAVIYFGGNNEDVAFDLEPFSKAFPDKSIYLVNYRGYGGSTGSPTEDALFADAIAVYDRVHETYPNISVIGRSLGTGVAVYLATARKVDSLVLVTPYDSIENVAKAHFPLFPISLLIKDRFDSAARAPNVTSKTLILLAANDRVIPAKNSENLIRQFPDELAVTKVFDGADHNSIGFADGYLRTMSEFMR